MIIFISFLSLPAMAQNVPYRVTEIATGLEHPWGVAYLPGGDFLVTERDGRLLHVTKNGDISPIANVPEVFNRGQGGLLDVILAMDFNRSRTIYFSYAAGNETNSVSNTEVAKATLNLRNKSLDNVEVIFKADPKVSRGNNHYGSRLLITPDNYLFITLGERFNYASQAQDPQNHIGAIIRLFPDGTIPQENPFANSDEGDGAVFSYGHRNVQGIAYNPYTREVWAHEHGPRGGDEVNILVAGENYGWPEVSYGRKYTGGKISDGHEGFKKPLLHWTPSIAPSGMDFYRGSQFPKWRGDLFVGALAERHLRRVNLENGRVVSQEKLLEDREERVRDVMVGPDGFIYVLTDELDGKLLRIEPQ
ncbi:MAG: PQQ-dependent sugar dehydrogenase [Pseudomonadota bacterium]